MPEYPQPTPNCFKINENAYIFSMGDIKHSKKKHTFDLNISLGNIDVATLSILYQPGKTPHLKIETTIKKLKKSVGPELQNFAIDFMGVLSNKFPKKSGQINLSGIHPPPIPSDE